MTRLSEPREPQRDATAPAGRQWARPELIVYGHLSKLTRGPSGMFTETGGMTPNMGCL